VVSITLSLSDLEDELKSINKLGYEWRKASILEEIGDLFNQIKEYKKSIEYYTESNKIYKNFNHIRGILETNYKIGLEERNLKNFKQAEKDFENTLNLANNFEHQEFVAKVSFELGMIQFLLENFKKCIINLEETCKLFEKLNNKIGETACANYIGESYLKLGDFDNSKQWLEKGLENSEIPEDLSYKSKIFLNFGILYFNEQNNQESFKYFEKALENESSRNNSIGKAIALNNLAIIYKVENQNDAAFNAFNEALKLLDINKDKIIFDIINKNTQETNKAKFNLKKIEFLNIPYNGLTEIEEKALRLINQSKKLYFSGNYDISLNNLISASKLLNSLGDHDIKVKCLLEIGTILAENREYKKALEFLNETNKYLSGLLYLPEINAKLGDVYQDVKDFNSALKYYDKMLMTAQKLGNLQAQADALTKIAMVLQNQKEFIKSNSSLDEAIKIYQQIGDVGGEKLAYELISTNYTGLKDVKTSLKFKTKANELSKKLNL